MKTSGDTNVKVAARCRPFNGELRISLIISNFYTFQFISLSDVAALVIWAVWNCICLLLDTIILSISLTLFWGKNCELLKVWQLWQLHSLMCISPINFFYPGHLSFIFCVESPYQLDLYLCIFGREGNIRTSYISCTVVRFIDNWTVELMIAYFSRLLDYQLFIYLYAQTLVL